MSECKKDVPPKDHMIQEVLRYLDRTQPVFDLDLRSQQLDKKDEPSSLHRLSCGCAQVTDNQRSQSSVSRKQNETCSKTSATFADLLHNLWGKPGPS